MWLWGSGLCREERARVLPGRPCESVPVGVLELVAELLLALLELGVRAGGAVEVLRTEVVHAARGGGVLRGVEPREQLLGEDHRARGAAPELVRPGVERLALVVDQKRELAEEKVGAARGLAGDGEILQRQGQPAGREVEEGGSQGRPVEAGPGAEVLADMYRAVSRACFKQRESSSGPELMAGNLNLVRMPLP